MGGDSGNNGLLTIALAMIELTRGTFLHFLSASKVAKLLAGCWTAGWRVDALCALSSSDSAGFSLFLILVILYSAEAWEQTTF